MPYHGTNVLRRVIVLALAGCGVDRETHAALEQRVDLLQRRLEVVEVDRVREPVTAEPVASRAAPPPPAAVVSPAASLRPVLRIAMGTSGVTIDGALIATDQLDETLARHAARRDLTSVLLDAAPDVEHREMMAMLDRIRNSGLDRVAIATRGGSHSDSDW